MTRRDKPKPVTVQMVLTRGSGGDGSKPFNLTISDAMSHEAIVSVDFAPDAFADLLSTRYATGSGDLYPCEHVGQRCEVRGVWIRFTDADEIRNEPGRAVFSDRMLRAAERLAEEADHLDGSPWRARREQFNSHRTHLVGRAQEHEVAVERWLPAAEAKGATP